MRTAIIVKQKSDFQVGLLTGLSYQNQKETAYDWLVKDAVEMKCIM